MNNVTIEVTLIAGFITILAVGVTVATYLHIRIDKNNDKIDNLNTALSAKIDKLTETVTTKLDELKKTIDAYILHK